jgi:hypothetical protein
MSQSSLWKIQTDSGDFAELCNALYQREISTIANADFSSAKAVQVRLQSLSYYINRTAHSMTQVMANGLSPLHLDNQNASWSVKQSKKIPVVEPETTLEKDNVFNWYLGEHIDVGLVVPVQVGQHIILDCIDRLDKDKNRIRTNVSGWFYMSEQKHSSNTPLKRLLKPNKKIMLAACAGHRWQGDSKGSPIIPTLRELLLSCSINWQNFKKPFVL